MKKYVKNLHVDSVALLREDYVLLKLTDPDQPLPPMRPGQFVEIRIRHAEDTFLRRPISINFVDEAHNELWLLVHAVGNGTRQLLTLSAGDTLDCMFPLGNGFSMPQQPQHLLLVGGGVGTAPLLYYGHCLRQAGHTVTFLLGGRSARDLLQIDDFERIGRVCLTTEDGSKGEKGFVTQHSVLAEGGIDAIATCGPKPMMRAVADYAVGHHIPCEASLENLMACGLGACLCCVEKNNDGHNVCVCTDGPVFNITQLQWHNSK